mgnify:FL=1|tara:strand:+ start:25 stop:618 length:594 start_codon:yes stop_codon:yes gene_type:complete
MALSKIESESINLADTFAFTGTVTGTDLVKLSTVDASDSATVNFDNSIITSSFVNYVLKYSRVVPETDQTTLNLMLSTDNGSNFLGNTKKGEDYNNLSSSASGPQQASGSNNGTIVLGYQDDGADGCAGTILINGLTSTGYKYADYRHIYRHGGGSDFYIVSGGAVFEYNAAFNYMRLASSSGAIESGKFTLYGEKA